MARKETEEELEKRGEPGDAQALARMTPVEKKSGPPAGARLWRVLVFLFNLTLIIVVVSAIGAGLYFGWPIVYDKYVLPVQNNTAQMARLEKRLEESNAQLAGVETQVASTQTEGAGQVNRMAGLEADMKSLGNEVSTQGKSLAELKVIRTTLDELQTALDEVKAGQEADKQALSDELEREIKILRGMELLSRARLFLYQSNFGLARQDVQMARDMLALQGPDLAEVVGRLDVCLGRLPEFPVAASDDLDIAWQLLLGGPQAAVPASLVEVTVTATVTITPTPSP